MAWLTLFPLALFATACSDDAEVIGEDPAGGATSGGSGGAGNGGRAGSAGNGGAGQAGNAGQAGAGQGGSGAGTADTTRPTVISTSPANAATGESPSTAISVTFDEAVRDATLTSETFILEQGATSVSGTVSHHGRVAIFVPASPLALDTTYSATLTTEIEDLAGNALAEAHTWSFETDAALALGPAPVLLGAAGRFAILAKSAITNAPTSVVTGDLGLSPAAASYATGFSLTRAGTKWTSAQVTGGVFAADNDLPTPTDLTTAVADMEAAYTDAAGRPTPGFVNLQGGAIGGLTLAPGLYNFTSTVTIPTDVTISGAPNDVWIFQISGDLTLSAAKRMTLIGGARAKNIFWQVAGTVNLGTTSHSEGIILSQTAIQLETGASINGRLLAQTAVNIASATVTAP
jgi:hypothetical protein